MSERRRAGVGTADRAERRRALALVLATLAAGLLCIGLLSWLRPLWEPALEAEVRRWLTVPARGAGIVFLALLPLWGLAWYLQRLAAAEAGELRSRTMRLLAGLLWVTPPVMAIWFWRLLRAVGSA